jgi:tRNA uridine 5-carboxymethylaminomethyl modification enzyme
MPGFDIIVVGAGHAGTEAAFAAARLGKRVACVTLRLEHIGRLSCNPAVGGLAKGHLVREIDALGGAIGHLADTACVQFRRLNTRKGLAVQSSRAQVDIRRYPEAARALLASTPDLTLIEGEAAEILVHAGRVTGLRLADGTEVRAPKVVLTTGTFLAGVLHRGAERTEGGRIGDGAAHRLSASLRALGLRLGRLKTGTTPRLDGRTIDWANLERQDDTVPDGRFSFRAKRPPRLPTIDCYLTYTTAQAHEVIRAHLHESPMYTGAIEGRGPRYCPSIEDKVVRFAERDRHLVYLEPEGLDTHRVYPNGISTSLPGPAQLAFLRTMPGLQRVEVEVLGYAVEYDFSDPRDLGPDLQHRAVPGLYLAGQVNGTSGYEEAAAQGLIAGLSAALGEPFLVARDEGYLGVLVDDLTTRGVGGEPYRMFTSRAEHRLLLREDNADRRLMPRGRALGLIDDATWAAFEARQSLIEAGKSALATTRVNPDPATLAAFADAGLGPLRKPCPADEILARPEARWALLAPIAGLPPLPDDVAEQVEIDTKYAGYVEKAKKRAAAARSLDAVRLPADADWRAVAALSWEVRERLAAARPSNVGQASRLPGVTPAAVDVLVAWASRVHP